MQAPPFRLAQSARAGLTESNSSGSRLRAADACCAPSPEELSQARRRRAKLGELDPHLHCSVIGTCLTTHELRKLVPKFADLDRQHASDLEIHHVAVELAIAGGPGGKALHKALDERYAGAIRRFDQARDEDALLALWNEALKTGDIPPAYWALMTHPYATMPVRQAAFGELHMLSHLVGAANRADIRRLVALEEENAALRDKVERQQNRLHEISMQRDTAIEQLTQQVVRLLTTEHDVVGIADGHGFSVELLEGFIETLDQLGVGVGAGIGMTHCWYFRVGTAWSLRVIAACESSATISEIAAL